MSAVERALNHIKDGDIFQANICARFEAPFDGSAVDLFAQGADALRPRFGAYLEAPTAQIASFSPELFLRRRGRAVWSAPIKGTAPRRDENAMAQEQRHHLESSTKDRAENVMIVDLMRNDLGRVCRFGSVRVPALVRVEGHVGVWHLVSDVTGELRPEVQDGALLRATFPPGSVTGAPKVRAMEVIHELESTAREVYTGAIGYMSPLTGLELSVVIRTFEIAAGRIWLGIGGGIVADSIPHAELEECYVKARPLFSAIESRA
jgi:para-aminobenzoate synthetase/4-amino-4-deoxychorismate lyase